MKACGLDCTCSG